MKAQENRIACAPLRRLSVDWHRVAKRWAQQHGRDVCGVLDMFDEIASVRFYFGEPWTDAQARAWSDVVEILKPFAVAGAA